MCFCVEGNMELLPFSLFVRSWRKLKDGVEEHGRSIWSIACMFWEQPAHCLLGVICLHVGGGELVGLALVAHGPLSPPLPPPIISDFSIAPTASSSLSIRGKHCALSTVLCALCTVCKPSGSVHCFLECTDGPRHAIRPEVRGTNTC